MGPRLYPDEQHNPHHEDEAGFHDDEHGGEHEDIVYFDEDDQDRPRFALLRPVLLVLVAAGCAGALWFAYSKSKGPGEVPLIRADQSAAKVRPDNPGGEQVPDQDKTVYNRNQPGGQVEKLLPGPEQPMARPLVMPQSDPNAPLPTQEVGEAAAPKSIPQAPGLPAAPPPTTKNGTMLSPPDGTKSVPDVVIPPAPPPQTAAVPGKPGAASAPTGGVFKVQIAATRDEATAQSEWERLKRAHTDLLGSLSPTVVRADLGDKGIFYRIQAGPVPDQAKADKLCADLKKLSIGCIVVKP